MFTRALCGIIPVCRKACAALHLSVVNVAVANARSVLLPVTYSLFSKDFQGTFSSILVDYLMGCFHKKFIEHFQRTYFLSYHQDSILYIVLNTVIVHLFHFSLRVASFNIFLIFLSCINPKQKQGSLGQKRNHFLGTHRV